MQTVFRYEENLVTEYKIFYVIRSGRYGAVEEFKRLTRSVTSLAVYFFTPHPALSAILFILLCRGKRVPRII